MVCWGKVLIRQLYILQNPTRMTELEVTCTNHCVTKPPHSTPMIVI
jgi:hypothetical protein